MTSSTVATGATTPCAETHEAVKRWARTASGRLRAHRKQEMARKAVMASGSYCPNFASVASRDAACQAEGQSPCEAR